MVACTFIITYPDSYRLFRQVPLVVYLEDTAGSHGYRPIAKYGENFRNRRPVRL